MTAFDPELIGKMNRIQSRANRSLSRSGPQGLARLQPEPIDDDDEEIEWPAIEGKGFSYGTVMAHKGEFINLNPGCVDESLASNSNILLVVDHDTDAVLADKSTGLSIIATDDGILFRCDVSKSKNPMALMGVVASKNRRCVSVGLDILKSEVHRCGNHDVRFVTEARIRELSLVKLGLDPTAFAFVTNSVKYAAPTAKARSKDFERNETAYLAARAAIDTGMSNGQLEQLKARITALEALLGIPNEEDHRTYIAAILRGEIQLPQEHRTPLYFY